MDASAELAKVEERRAQAVGRLADQARDARAAAAEAATAAATLSEFERVGGTSAKRRGLEQGLAQARARAAEPWP
jgi:hypothetical protein